MRFAFYSCMSGMPWGGSEELWYLAARRLQDAGHEIRVNYKWWPEPANQLTELRDAGAQIEFRDSPNPSWSGRLASLLHSMSKRNGVEGNWLTRQNPDMLLVTAGYHPDRIQYAQVCQKRRIPYAINVQCASHSAFIHERRLDAFRQAYSGATKVFFVSQENQEKLETNLAMKLTNAELVCNPFNVSIDNAPTWPADDTVFRLACVGRIHFVSKGHDLLVKVLSSSKWRERPIEVLIYGKDQGNERQLRDLVRIHHLEDKIKFAGFATDIEQLWAENHGLILPSRYEGAALVVVEAMMCHRLAITTDIGRNRELIDDNQSGFIASAPTVELIDDALERAWSQRNRWREMGLQAGQDIRERFCHDPVGDFAERLTSIAQQSKRSQVSRK